MPRHHVLWTDIAHDSPVRRCCGRARVPLLWRVLVHRSCARCLRWSITLLRKKLGGSVHAPAGECSNCSWRTRLFANHDVRWAMVQRKHGPEALLLTPFLACDMSC
jgi:hypothetical protein